MTAIPAATYHIIQYQLAAARAQGDVAKAQRLEALLASATPLPGTTTPAGGPIRRLARSRVSTIAILPGDIVRVAYRNGTVVANDIRVTRADLASVTGYVGGVVYADGRVASWWNDPARLQAGSRLPPITYPRASVQAVARSGVQIA